MIYDFMLAKGSLDANQMQISRSNKPLDADGTTRLTRLIRERVPRFIFQDVKGTRTLLIEDAVGINFLKLFKGVEAPLHYLLVRIEGRLFSQQEIQKISIRISKFLDIKLDFDKSLEKVNQIIVDVESYDFSRPIKSSFAPGTILSKEDKNIRLEQLLPKINLLRFSGDRSEKLEYVKYKIFEKVMKCLRSHMLLHL